MRCDECRFFEPIDNRKRKVLRGLCRSGPPMIYNATFNNDGHCLPQCGWPIVSGDDWCGACEPRELTLPVSVLDFSQRTKTCMERKPINTLNDLCSHTSDDLLNLRNFGVTSLNEVRTKLRERGLYLKNETPPT